MPTYECSSCYKKIDYRAERCPYCQKDKPLAYIQEQNKAILELTNNYGCGFATVLLAIPVIVMPIVILQGEEEIIGPWFMVLIFFLISLYLYKKRKKRKVLKNSIELEENWVCEECQVVSDYSWIFCRNCRKKRR